MRMGDGCNWLRTVSDAGFCVNPSDSTTRDLGGCDTLVESLECYTYTDAELSNHPFVLNAMWKEPKRYLSQS